VDEAGRLDVLFLGLSAGAMGKLPRPDVTWTAAGEVTLPWSWSQAGPLRRPLIRDLDATFDQMEATAELYWKRRPRKGVRLAASRAVERGVWRNATMFTPWSRWAADGLRAAGIPDERICVLPPGIELDYWRTAPRTAPRDRPIRLLFVGGDFERKGGPLLVDAVRASEAGTFELDIVTRDPAAADDSRIRVHRAEPEDALLQRLYRDADAFVLPTRAECFGIAAVEALAAGLPVVMGDVGGAADIVDDGRCGWRIAPTREGVEGGLAKLIAAREQLPALGAEAEAKARRSFDARDTCARLLDLIVRLGEERRRGKR